MRPRRRVAMYSQDQQSAGVVAYALYGSSHGIGEADMLAAILQRDMPKKGNRASQYRYALYTIRRARGKADRPR